MQFIDEAVINVSAGNGGDGIVAWRREKYVPKGGPAGGDGGRGGDVVLVADPELGTLVDFRFKKQFGAESGKPGGQNNKAGPAGKELVVRVPVGTLVTRTTVDHEGARGQARLFADLSTPLERVRVAKGGRGGQGNQHFATAARQAPHFAYNGEPGEKCELKLELKLLADAGVIGLPNAGKSTLLSVVSAARPKIADYPFTTLTPNLGVVRLNEDRSFVVADVPGLIEGAHRGLGLGHQFLRHLERTKVLVHLVDVSGASGRDPVEDLDTVRKELELFQPTLAAKPQIVVANKIDAAGPDQADAVKALRRRASILDLPFLQVSGASGQGVPELLEAMWRRLASSRQSAV